MTFDEILLQTLELLQREGRVSYRALKRRFALDDDYVEDLKAELIDAKHLAIDEDSKVLVWTGNSSPESRVQPLKPEQVQGPKSKVKTPNSERNAAERRQLTVMFIDLVGSTTLSQQLDPEDYHARVVAYQAACRQVIERYEGHIAQYLGDGVLVYFGYPAAHDEDAVRAVRSGLEIITAIQRMVPSPLVGEGQGEGAVGAQCAVPLQVRLGIHTGLVVIGEIGSNEKRELLALGETPNLAARIQGQANPDEVMISAATYRLVEGLFACEDRGQPELKGVTTPLTLYRVTKESEVQSRFEVAIQQGLTPLVGREEELALLRRRWQQATAGEGQVVLLSGEPGIGKSRLVQELKDQVAHDNAVRIEFRCSPYHQNSALYPIIDHLQRLLRFAREDSPEDKLRKLEHALRRKDGAYGLSENSQAKVIASAAKQSLPETEIASSPVAPRNDNTRLQEMVPLLAALLSLPHPEGYPPLTFSPQKQKEKTHEALVTWLIEETKQNTIYNVWEDLHWADPSTLEVLNLVVDQAPTTKLYMLLTFRPEFNPPWGNRSHLTQLILRRLERRQVETMVERVTGNTTLPQEVVQQIVSKTDGVPLFVEELTKTVVESVGALREAPLRLEIPATLQDSLMARLDRLGAAKEIAQLGATIGREFSYELLRTVSLFSSEVLQHGLKLLVEAELVYQRGLTPQATYLFKHALIQDTAYQSLLKSTRQQYHQQIARKLEEQFPETKETQPELLAHHYTEAGLIAQALPYWQRAGEQAAQRSAFVEAVTHFTKGLVLLKTQPDTPERIQQELTLQIALGSSLMTTKGAGAFEVGETYARARELCQRVGETPQIFPVLWGLRAFYQVRGECRTARGLAEQMLRLAQSVQDPVLLLGAHYALETSLHFLGEFALARIHWEQGIILYNPQQHHTYTAVYGGQAPGIPCLSNGSYVLWLLGYPDQALKRCYEALTLAQDLSHPPSLAFALIGVDVLHNFRREGQAARERAEAVIALSREQGLPFQLTAGLVHRGWALAQQGQGEKGIAQIREGLTASRTIGTEGYRASYLGILAEAYRTAGQPEEGLTVLAEALAVVEKTGERWWEAELYRLKGELLLTQEVKSQKAKGKRQKSENTDPQALTPDPQSEAEACFLKAIEISRKQQAKSLELRAVMSLIRLRQHQAQNHEARTTQHEARTRLDEAHTLLSEVYGWFTEGFDTKDLQEAKALLDELSKG